MYKEIIDKLNKKDLAEIANRLNDWKWDDRLGEKPKDWDSMPNYILNNYQNFPTKRDIVTPIYEYIETKIGEKAIMKNWHINHCNMTNFQHEIWWIKHCIQKFFGIGFYSKKTQKAVKNILQSIVERDKREWINKTYYNK